MLLEEEGEEGRKGGKRPSIIAKKGKRAYALFLQRKKRKGGDFWLVSEREKREGRSGDQDIQAPRCCS